MLLILAWLYLPSAGQGVHPVGTFITIPAAQHINHMYIGSWKAFFASEDGVLVYDMIKNQWRTPITISQGLSQYPVLLVWADESSQDVWMVTPDNVFIYNMTSHWMGTQQLPHDPGFTGSYALGSTPRQVVVRASGDGVKGSVYATYGRSSTHFESWGTAEELNLLAEDIDWIHHFQSAEEEDLFGIPVPGGTFKTGGVLELDGIPNTADVQVTCLARSDQDHLFIGTYGRGLYHQSAAQIMAQPLSQGLLSPDVMTLSVMDDRIWVGNRTGITSIDSTGGMAYEREIEQTVFDAAYVSAILPGDRMSYLAARGGVFQINAQSQWNRLLSTTDLDAERIYGLDKKGSALIIGTERGAVEYYLAGSFRHLFPKNELIPTFDVLYVDDRIWCATLNGLQIYDPGRDQFLVSVDSYGATRSFQNRFILDPFYELELDSTGVWTSTNRGILQFRKNGELVRAWLAPISDFTPRGLTVQDEIIWVGTEQGLWLLNTESGAWRTLTMADGLPSNFITDLASTGDYIWAGTNYGLARISWKNIVLNW